MQLVSSYLAADLGVGSVADGMALVVQGGMARLIYSEAELNAAMSLSLGSVTAPGSGYVSSASLAAPGITSPQPASSIAFQNTGSAIRAFLFDSHSGVLTSALLGATGAPGGAQSVTTSVGALHGVQTFAIMGGAGGDCAVLSTWNKAGLDIYLLASDGSMVYEGSITDSPKSYVGNVSDTAAITLGGVNYLLTLSSLENGLTSYQIGSDDTPTLIDSLGTHDGLWVSGPAAMQIIDLGGVTYAVIASTGSSSLSVVRVNAMGCLFVTDHVIDDLTTRFEHPQVLDSFSLQGRAFVVSAGTDAGITVMELLPDGRLSPFYTVALETGAGLYNVTGLQVALNGSMLDIFVVDAHADRIQRFEMALDTLGGVIQAAAGTATGSTRDDLILGSAAAETLTGGAGDDWLHSGGGTDALSGGSGADVFVFDASPGTDRITDYEKHTDRIDLSGWGHVYDLSALTITATVNGCTIAYGDHLLAVTTVNGHDLTVADFALTDFIF